MINPFLSAPPKMEMYSFSSGRMRLKLVVKRNIEAHKIQKFAVNVRFMGAKIQPIIGCVPIRRTMFDKTRS